MKIKLLIIGIILAARLYSQPTDPFMKALAELSMNRNTVALNNLDTAIAANSENSTYLIKRADVLFNEGMFLKAQKDYLTANKIQQGCGLYGLARCNAVLGKNAVAVDYLKKHLESKYKLSQKMIKLDPAFSSLENSKEWKTLWQQEWYNKYDYAASEAELMINNKEYTDAINLLSTILKEHEKKHDLLAWRGRAYYAMKSYKNALSDFSDAIELNKRNPAYLKERANTYIKLLQYNEAIIDLNAAVHIDSTDLKLYLKRAETLRLNGKYNEAVNDVATYTRYMGFSEEATFIAAKAMYDKGDFMQALVQINKILEKNKINSSYYLFRGNAYSKTNMPKYAVRDYGMSLDLDNKNIESWLKRGMARLSLGDKTGACHDFNEAARLKSNEAVELLQKNCVN